MPCRVSRRLGMQSHLGCSDGDCWAAPCGSSRRRHVSIQDAGGFTSSGWGHPSIQDVSRFTRRWSYPKQDASGFAGGGWDLSSIQDACCFTIAGTRAFSRSAATATSGGRQGWQQNCHCRCIQRCVSFIHCSTLTGERNGAHATAHHEGVGTATRAEAGSTNSAPRPCTMPWEGWAGDCDTGERRETAIPLLHFADATVWKRTLTDQEPACTGCWYFQVQRVQCHQQQTLGVDTRATYADPCRCHSRQSALQLWWGVQHSVELGDLLPCLAEGF
mmetsp:Transcript_88199/g.175168  ORF Transcript_88199/g.175168 Transcript_88199/m.175168 type:complete len:274 (-) Transcript_88199:493-1314(-)